jgi:hypothetical protein
MGAMYKGLAIASVVMIGLIAVFNLVGGIAGDFPTTDANNHAMGGFRPALVRGGRRDRHRG